MTVTVFETGSTRGFLHRPTEPGSDGAVLTHGAGANAESELLVAVAGALANAGVWALRCDLPFRIARPSGPPRPGTAAQDRKGLRDAIGELRTVAPGRVFVGGHSYGGRQASMLAAEEPDIADGLLLLSYPLHPPRKPAELRTAHFTNLRTPALFIHGTRDPFGSVEELRSALSLIPAVTHLVALEGMGHDLNHGKFDVAEHVLAPLRQYLLPGHR